MELEDKYTVVVFKNMGGVNYPVNPWPVRMVVTRFLHVSGSVEVSRLTLTTFLLSVLQNFVTLNYWRFMRLLYWMGFLDVPEACAFSWYYWRWDFWRVLKERREEETKE